jgi:RimJ/RimL family protein N-acetyltransferase
MAKHWVASCGVTWLDRSRVSFAITLKETDTLVGSIALTLSSNTEAALGYWIGVDYWGNAYASEAGQSIADYAFKNLGLKRLYAHHLQRNPNSGRVLINAGFTHLGSGTSPCGYNRLEQATENYERCMV